MPKTRQPKPIWFGMKLTPQQKQQIRLLARQRNTSAKQALMELVEAALRQRSFKAPRVPSLMAWRTWSVRWQGRRICLPIPNT